MPIPPKNAAEDVKYCNIFILSLCVCNLVLPVEDRMVVPQKLKIEPAHDLPASHLPKLESSISKRNLHTCVKCRNVIASVF